MNVPLSPELEAFITREVASGRYTSPIEVVHNALRLLEEQDQQRTAELAAFHHELDQRIASLDRGEFVDPETTRQRVREGSNELTRRSA